MLMCPEYGTKLKSVGKMCFSSDGFCWDLDAECVNDKLSAGFLLQGIFAVTIRQCILSQRWIEIHFIWKQCILKICFWQGSKGLFVKAFVNVDIRHRGGLWFFLHYQFLEDLT